MIEWFKQLALPRRSAADEKYAQAMMLTNEVEKRMQDHASSSDPFRAVMAEIWLQNHDTTLVSDSFEIHQESRIYKGPPK